MIGYVTLGTKDAEAAKGFYDGLLGLLGANRMMDMGSFTVWGLGFDKPGLANPLRQAMERWLPFRYRRGRMFTPFMLRLWNWVGHVKDCPACGETKDPMPFTRPIFVISMAINSAPTEWVQPDA
jgi:catechol 2,3-dioxygenase-like lactoylglutathione lyase family enzyme